MGVGGSPKGTLISSGISTDIPWPSTVGLEAWLTTGGGASGKQDRGPSLTREKVQREMKKGRVTQGGLFPKQIVKACQDLSWRNLVSGENSGASV